MYSRLIHFKSVFHISYSVRVSDVQNVEQILETLLGSQLVRLVILLGICFFALWLLLAAKRVVPLTREDAETLWKFNKQKTQCRAKNWREITHKKKMWALNADADIGMFKRSPLSP